MAKRLLRSWTIGLIIVIGVIAGWTAVFSGYVQNYPPPLLEKNPYFSANSVDLGVSDGLNQKWYNPYHGIDMTKSVLGGFHYHSFSQFKSYAPGEMFSLYQRRGLNFINFSDYNQITNTQTINPYYLPGYEHGLTLWPLRSHHFTVLDPAQGQPIPIKFPWYQRIQDLQNNINRFHNRAGLLILNHPNHFDTWRDGELRVIKNLDGLEVLTPYGNSTYHWDSLLSSGQLVWGLSAPDIHDPYQKSWAARYLVLFPQQDNGQGVLEALQHGQFYAVWDKMWSYPVYLKSVEVVEDRYVQVSFTGIFRDLQVVGINGQPIKHERYVSQISFVLDEMKPYLRVVGKNPNYHLLLNPFVNLAGYSANPNVLRAIKKRDKLPPTANSQQPDKIPAPLLNQVYLSDRLSWEAMFYLTTLARGVLGHVAINVPGASSYDICNRTYRRFFGSSFPPSALDDLHLAPLWFLFDDSLDKLAPAAQASIRQILAREKPLIVHWRQQDQVKQLDLENVITIDYRNAAHLQGLLRGLFVRVVQDAQGIVATKFLAWATAKSSDLLEGGSHLPMPRLAEKEQEQLRRIVQVMQQKFSALKKQGLQPEISQRLKGGFFEFFGGLVSMVHGENLNSSYGEALAEVMRLHMLTGSVAKPGAGFFCLSTNDNIGSVYLGGATDANLPLLFERGNLKGMNRLAFASKTRFQVWRTNLLPTSAAWKNKAMGQLLVIGDSFAGIDKLAQASMLRALQLWQSRQGKLVFASLAPDSPTISHKLLASLKDVTPVQGPAETVVSTYIDGFRQLSRVKRPSYFKLLQALDGYLRPGQAPLFQSEEQIWHLLIDMSRLAPADFSGLNGWKDHQKLFATTAVFWPIYPNNNTMDVVYRYRYRYQQNVTRPSYGVGPGSLGMFYANGECCQ